MRKVNI